MSKINLRPNDRIFIGTQFIFLFKDKLNEKLASINDYEDSPITYDFAIEEIMNNLDKKRF